MKQKLLILFLIMAPVFLSGQSYEELVEFSANPSKLNVEEGEEFYVLLNYHLEEGWKTYTFEDQINEDGIGPATTELTFLDTPMVVAGKPFHKKPIRKFDEGFEFELDYFTGNFDVIIPVKAKQDIDFNSDDITLEVYFMICEAARCLPPSPMNVKVGNEIFNPEDFEFFNKDRTSLEQGNTNQTDSDREIDEKKKEGIWSFLWFAMLAGAGALVTPCVFPMIPITVSFFTKRAEKARVKGVRDSFIYATGIIITFTGIGFALAMMLGPTGIRDFAADGWVNLAIAAIFIIFALNLFGAFEIQIPSGIMNKLNRQTGGSGIGSILAMGLVFSLTSFTCTVPFVGSALISATTGGEWFHPIIGMLGFSAVFASPFFLLALFPSMLSKMPKAGGWMNNVKVVMGFLEIAAAVKFISNADLVWAWGIMPRDAFLAIWIICGILIVFYVLGAFKLKMDSDIGNLSSVRVIWAILFGSITIYLIPGLFGKPLGELDAFLPPKGYLSGEVQSNSSFVFGGDGNKGNEQVWIKDYDKAVKMAKEENKTIFLDFTGWTCTNCRWMESNVFPLAKVQDYFDDMITVKLYTDRRKEPELSNKKLQQEKFNSIDLPLYVLMTPNEEVIGTKAFTRDVDEFLTFLEKGAKSNRDLSIVD